VKLATKTLLALCLVKENRCRYTVTCHWIDEFFCWHLWCLSMNQLSDPLRP
jgi:hypothetical protein